MSTITIDERTKYLDAFLQDMQAKWSWYSSENCGNPGEQHWDLYCQNPIWNTKEFYIACWDSYPGKTLAHLRWMCVEEIPALCCLAEIEVALFNLEVVHNWIAEIKSRENGSRFSQKIDWSTPFNGE